MKLGHIGIPVADMQTSKKFYDAIVPHLGLERIDESEKSVRYGKNGSTRFYIHGRSKAVSGVHICFDVASQEDVDSFYTKALLAGGVDNGVPGVRTDYSPTYYAAFVIDPDGNNIEAVFRD